MNLSIDNLNTTDSSSLLITHSTPTKLFNNDSFENNDLSSVVAHSICIENESNANNETTTTTKY